MEDINSGGLISFFPPVGVTRLAQEEKIKQPNNIYKQVTQFFFIKILLLLNQ